MKVGPVREAVREGLRKLIIFREFLNNGENKSLQTIAE